MKIIKRSIPKPRIIFKYRKRITCSCGSILEVNQEDLRITCQNDQYYSKYTCPICLRVNQIDDISTPILHAIWNQQMMQKRIIF